MAGYAGASYSNGPKKESKSQVHRFHFFRWLAATAGRANSGTASGTIAQQIQTAARELSAGQNSDANLDLIHRLMTQFLDQLRTSHQDTTRANVRFQQIEAELKNLAGQVRNNQP